MFPEKSGLSEFARVPFMLLSLCDFVATVKLFVMCAFYAFVLRMKAP